MMGYTHQILYMCEQKTQICSKDDSLCAQTKINDNQFYMVIDRVTVHLECVSLAFELLWSWTTKRDLILIWP